MRACQDLLDGGEYYVFSSWMRMPGLLRWGLEDYVDLHVSLSTRDCCSLLGSRFLSVNP